MKAHWALWEYGQEGGSSAYTSIASNSMYKALHGQSVSNKRFCTFPYIHMYICMYTGVCICIYDGGTRSPSEKTLAVTLRTTRGHHRSACWERWGLRQRCTPCPHKSTMTERLTRFGARNSAIRLTAHMKLPSTWRPGSKVSEEPPKTKEPWHPMGPTSSYWSG